MSKFLLPFRLILASALLMPALALAHEPAVKAPVATLAASAEEEPVVAVVDAFSAALKAGDLELAASFLHPNLLVLESGGAERSRAEYLAEHAGADAEFLREARIQALTRRASAVGDLAWVASESRIEYQREGVTKRVLSTETMVLRREAGVWKIVHIHWSSRPEPEPKPAG